MLHMNMEELEVHRIGVKVRLNTDTSVCLL